MPVAPIQHLKSIVHTAADELDGADALDVLRWVDETLNGRVVVASSMQDAVVVDLASQVHPGIDVIFLDTGYHFAETLGMRDAVAATHPVRLLTVKPGDSVAEQDAEHGPRLHDRNPDLCCFLRKVTPLNTILSLYDGWITGLRRVDTPDRATASAVEWDERREIVKVNPIVEWTDEDVETYIKDHNILVNPLLRDGYASVGCEPCTSRTLSGDPRAGRWAGTTKTECGIHL